MNIYGCMDNTLSDHLKCIIKQGPVVVVGRLPEGYSTSLQHNWISPFSEDTPGSVFQKGASFIQALTGKTATGFLQSFLTWEGSDPMDINIPLVFEAEDNPDKEVRIPVNILEMMSAPQFSHDIKSLVNDFSFAKAVTVVKSRLSQIEEDKAAAFGNKIPQTISIKIGRNLVLKKCVIESVEKEDPMTYSSDGLPLQLSVTLNIKTRSTLDTSDLSTITQ